MPTRAGCAGSEVPAPAPPRRRGAERPCSQASSSSPTMPRAHWTPSPCGRLSRPPRWVVTPTTTTSPPPRPGGNGGRYACPDPEGTAGTAGALPTFTHTPAGRVGAQLYPGGIATPHRNTRCGLARPNRNGTDESVLSNNEDRAPQQPITASFGAAALSRGLRPLVSVPRRLSALLRHPGPLAADRCSIVRGCSRPPPRLRPRTAPRLHPAVCGCRGWVLSSTRLYGA